jgi:hypothetical protein
LEFLRSGGEAKPMSASDEKALLRKIDWRIMPLMFGCYTLRMCRLGTKQAACL